MSKEERLEKINKELKIYLNESGFVSTKCRDKVLKMFAEEFSVDLDINLYANVDLSFTDDYQIIYRGDYYTSSNAITSLNDLDERYNRFKERVDSFLKNKKLDFNSKSKHNNITNLIIVILMLIVVVFITIYVIKSFFRGNFFNCLWFVFILLPAIVPNFKNDLISRITQAKNYLKSLRKKK